MITNRSLLRIKVLQALYAYECDSDHDASKALKDLEKSVQQTTDLFFHLLMLSVSVTRHARLCIDAAQNKLRPTEEEKNPNLKFVNNLFVKQLLSNKVFNDTIRVRHLEWQESPVLKVIYDRLKQADFYAEYMRNDVNDYDEDKRLWRQIYENIVADNEEVYEALEDESIYWADDLDLALSYVVKVLKQAEEENGGEQVFPTICSPNEVTFAKDLLAAAIEHEDEYKAMISDIAENWDQERLMLMDMLIMVEAIAEMVAFPTIAVSVTINEFIEVAKCYSGEKSPAFVNGVLDKAVERLKAEGKLVKVVIPNVKLK